MLESEDKIDHLQLKTSISGIAAFTARARIVYPQKKLLVCRDPKDDMLLECCLESKAEILITGDKDILEIENLPFNLKILSPRKFLEEN